MKNIISWLEKNYYNSLLVIGHNFKFEIYLYKILNRCIKFENKNFWFINLENKILYLKKKISLNLVLIITIFSILFLKKIISNLYNKFFINIYIEII